MGRREEKGVKMRKKGRKEKEREKERKKENIKIWFSAMTLRLSGIATRSPATYHQASVGYEYWSRGSPEIG